MKLCGIDFETDSLDANSGKVTEVGLVMYDTDFRSTVRLEGFLVKMDTPVPAEITKLTGITTDVCNKYGRDRDAALSYIIAWVGLADACVAHNAPFDRGFLEAWCKKAGKQMPDRPWIDTRTDLPIAAYERGKSASLKYLAADHGFVYLAHRAVSDVLAMFQIFEQYPLEKILERSRTPNVEVRAVVSFSERLQAKERGYYWKPELKLWIKPLKLNMVAAEKEQAPFPVVLMTETAAV